MGPSGTPGCWAEQVLQNTNPHNNKPDNNRSVEKCFAEAIPIQITTRAIALRFSCAKTKEGVPRNSLC